MVIKYVYNVLHKYVNKDIIVYNIALYVRDNFGMLKLLKVPTYLNFMKNIVNNDYIL